MIVLRKSTKEIIVILLNAHKKGMTKAMDKFLCEIDLDLPYTVINCQAWEIDMSETILISLIFLKFNMDEFGICPCCLKLLLFDFI